MASYVVHRDINNGTYNFRAGDTFDDASINPATFRAAGGKCSLDQDDTTLEGAAMTSDLDAPGGFRQTIGPFVGPGAAGVVAADQTNLDLDIGAPGQKFWIATRAGSILGLVSALSAAITGATKTLTAKVTIDGTEVGAALNNAYTTGGAEVVGRTTGAKDASGLTFAVGAKIGVSYTSTTITNTPALTAWLEIEQ